MQKVFMITEEQLKVWQAIHKVTDSQMNELKISSQTINNGDYVILQMAKDISLNQPTTSIIIDKKMNESGYYLAFTQNGSEKIETDISVKVPPSNSL